MAAALQNLYFLFVANKLFGVDKLTTSNCFNFSDGFPKYTSYVSSFLKSCPSKYKIWLVNFAHFKIRDINQSETLAAEFPTTRNEVKMERLSWGPTTAERKLNILFYRHLHVDFQCTSGNGMLHHRNIFLRSKKWINIISSINREYVHSVAVYQKYLTRLGELIIFEPWLENYQFSQPSYLFIFWRLICWVLSFRTSTDKISVVYLFLSKNIRGLSRKKYIIGDIAWVFRLVKDKHIFVYSHTLHNLHTFKKNDK